MLRCDRSLGFIYMPVWQVLVALPMLTILLLQALACHVAVATRNSTIRDAVSLPIRAVSVNGAPALDLHTQGDPSSA